MSQKIRIGNDIDIRWSLVDENENPYILEGRDVRIELNVGKKKIRITEIELNENTVHFIYYGKDQKYTGQYILKFIENDGNVEMVTFDTKDAFTLVEHSWLAIDDGEEPERVYLEFVTVTSNILERIGPTGPAAGFGEVTASIDDGVGTPTVDVSTSGPDTAKNITFNFHNLKGASAGVKIDLGSGSTVTGADIAAILADGKIPYAMNGEQYVYYAGSDNTYYYFQWDYSPSAQNAVQQSYRTGVPKNGAWGGSFSLVTPEDTRKKVSTIIGNESDETKYPNTKAVYDFINGKYQRIYNCDISEVTNPVEGDVCIASIETETQISLPSGVTSSEISLPGSTFRWKKSYASLAPLNGVTLTWRELEGEWQESKLPDRNNRGTITTGDATTAYLSWGSSGNLSGLTFYSVESVPSPYIYLNGSWVLSSDIALNVYVAVPINNEYDVSSIEAALAAGKVVFIPDGVFCGRDQGNNLIFVLPKYDGLGFYVTTINATYGTWSSEEINLQQAITSSNKLDFSLLSNTPTTLAGYGITNAYTKNEIDAKVSSVYKPAGSAASVAALGSLTAANLGNVYNMSAAFTTTSDFVEGASKDYPAGTNVVIVNTGTDADPVYKYDVLAGMVDLSGYEETTNKVTSFGSTPSDSKYPSEKLVKNSLDAKQDTISDLSTIRSGAAAGATAYQKPGTGIPKTDLASAVQTSLGKADSAVQPADIPDPLLTYTESGEIDPTVTPADYATTEQLSQLSQEIHGFKYEGAFNITTTGDHSSNNDRITFPSTIPAGEYTFKVESGTTGNTGSASFYVKYVGASSTTNIGGGILGTVITAELTNPIESIGIYMNAATNQHTGSMPLTIESTADNIKKDIQQLQDDVTEAEQNIESDKKYVLNNRFAGAGSAFSSIKLYGLKAGIKYRIELQNPSLLTDTTSDTTAKKFVVNYLKTDSTRGVLVYKNIGDGAVSGYYEFTMPNDMAENGDIEVGGRAVAGKIINFSIYAVQTLDYITYGVVRCTTAAATTNKEVTIPGLIAANSERVRFIVYMINPTTTWAKLSVNGGTAINIRYNGAPAGAANSWAANEYLDVIYNSGYNAYLATTRTNLSQTVNQDSPNKQKVISEAGIVNYVEGNVDKNVRFYNTDKESAIASAASRSPLVYEKTNDGLCPVFSILTDLHSDLDRFKRACAYADNVSEVLATLCLGDLINHSNAQNPYPLILNYTKPVISITGNHEVLKSGTITGWSESDIISNMYNPDQVAHNGETHPTDKCYWYKDFSKTIDGATKKLRVIGLHQYEGSGTGEQNTGSGKDVCFYSQDQIDWLIARLDEVDSNTWVMLLIHYAPTANMTRIECPFTPSSSFNFPLQGGSNTGGSSSMSDDEFIPKIIQAWIDGTTLNISCDITVGETVTTITAVKATAFSAHTLKFAGYFCGHTHRDFVGKLTNYPKQLQFAFITTSAATSQQSCDIGRETSGKTQDCFTLVGIDWFKNSVNLIRIGADTTTDMRERKYANIPIPTV